MPGKQTEFVLLYYEKGNLSHVKGLTCEMENLPANIHVNNLTLSAVLYMLKEKFENHWTIWGGNEYGKSYWCNQSYHSNLSVS